MVWWGLDAIFHGSPPGAYRFIYFGVALIPMLVGVASARINMRCPACDTRLGVRIAKTCPGCQKQIFSLP